MTAVPFDPKYHAPHGAQTNHRRSTPPTPPTPAAPPKLAVVPDRSRTRLFFEAVRARLARFARAVGRLVKRIVMAPVNAVSAIGGWFAGLFRKSGAEAAPPVADVGVDPKVTAPPVAVADAGEAPAEEKPGFLTRLGRMALKTVKAIVFVVATVASFFANVVLIVLKGMSVIVTAAIVAVMVVQAAIAPEQDRSADEQADAEVDTVLEADPAR